MSAKTIADVRDHLFRLLDQLGNESKTPDYERMRASCDVAQVMVNTVRLQVDYLKVIQGDGDVPFLEEPKPDVSPAAAAATARVFAAGPAEDHPWRTRVHRLQR